jgi:hypothetical protein
MCRNIMAESETEEKKKDLQTTTGIQTSDTS